MSKVEDFIMSNGEDLNIKLDGEKNYLDTREKLMDLDSNNITI